MAVWAAEEKPAPTTSLTRSLIIAALGKELLVRRRREDIQNRLHHGSGPSSPLLTVWIGSPWRAGGRFYCMADGESDGEKTWGMRLWMEMETEERQGVVTRNQLVLINCTGQNAAAV